MISLLTEKQNELYIRFKKYVNEKVIPFASEWDCNEEIPRESIIEIGKLGYLGSLIPTEYGGQNWDVVTFGLLNEAVGRGTAALADLLTIQGMISITLLKWGTVEQKSSWLRLLAEGKIIGAFALTEPGAGSNIKAIKTQLYKDGNKYRLNGNKRWISYGQIADLFLVFGKSGDESLACLLPKDSPGLEVESIKNMMGFKAAKMAQLNFNNIEIPYENIIGKPGFALSMIAPFGLHYGRISTACSALGLLRACYEESISYASQRQVYGKSIGNRGMLQTLLTRMGTDLRAASLLCYSACRTEDAHLSEAFEDVLMAKYFTSRAVVNAASDAVQIHGASGCNESSPVARYYRDSKIFEIIEGTTQIYEKILGKTFLDKLNEAETVIS